MEGYNTDKKVVDDGRKNSLKGKIEAASLRDQIPAKLARKLVDRGIGEQVSDLWTQGQADQVDWLSRMQEMLKEVDEFVSPLYPAPYDWSSTLHMPVAYTLCRTFHSRMLSALFSFDPPFTVSPRKEANADAAPLVQDVMRYAIKDWSNNYRGIEETCDRWIWQWVTAGRGILKTRWDKQYSRFMDVVQVPKPVVQYSVDEQGNEIQNIGQVLVEEEQEVVKTIFEGPSVELVLPEDLLIIGGEGDVDKADSVLHQKYMTASELWSLADQGIFDEDAVKAVIAAGPDLYAGDVTGGIKDERARRATAGSIDKPFDTDRYRVIEAYLKVDVDGSGIASDVIVWTGHKSRELLRATYLFRVSPSGKRPFALIDFHRKGNTEKPVGLIELTYSLAKEIDFMHNLRVDFGLLSTLPIMFYRASSSMSHETIPLQPGAMIPLDNPQSDIYIPNMGNRTAFGFQEEAALMEQVQRMTSVSDLSLGVIGAQGATRTASGARIVASEASTNLDIYVKRMNRGFKKLLQLFLEMLQQKLPTGFEYNLTGEDGNNYFGRIENREQIAGLYDFELEGSSNSSNKQIQLDTAQQIYQMTGNMLDLQLGLISPLERYNAIKNLMQAMGIKAVSKYLRKPDQVVRKFTPEEVANRILAGIDVPLDPTQDLEGIIGYIDYIFANDNLLGQFGEKQAIALEMKKREAQALAEAMQAQAAQVANIQQQQTNAAQSQQQAGAGGFAAAPAPAQPPA